MAVTNPFSITYGSRSVGGSNGTFQLHGPYVIEKHYDSFRLVFDVIVVGTSHADLKTQSDNLETDFRKRLTHGQTLVVNISGNNWTYTVGTNLLKVKSSIAKTGNQDTDKGFSRAYTVSIEAELPADQDAGLRDVEVLVEYSPSRQKTVTMRGTYTAASGNNAKAQYLAQFDAEATAYLAAIDPSCTWELVTENYTIDRERNGVTPNPHTCIFHRQYVQLIVAQSQSLVDDLVIKDHRISFTDLSTYGGDASPNVYRLRRVIGNYDCAVDMTQSQDLQDVYLNKVRPHIRALFQQTYRPSTFAVEDQRISIDRTTNRISVALQFYYQTEGAAGVVELAQSVAYREARQIDYTPVHDGNELTAQADVGFMVLERVWNVTAVVLGGVGPKTRIYGGSSDGLWGGVFGIEGPGQRGNTSSVNQDGWNVIASTSQASPAWIGDPSQEQILVTTLVESVTERYTQKPTGTAGGRRSRPPVGGNQSPPTSGPRPNTGSV